MSLGLGASLRHLFDNLVRTVQGGGFGIWKGRAKFNEGLVFIKHCSCRVVARWVLSHKCQKDLT